MQKSIKMVQIGNINKDSNSYRLQMANNINKTKKLSQREDYF